MATTMQLRHCVFCNGDTHEGTTTLEFAFDDVTVIIDGVPAMLCDSCDEAYIDGQLGTAISELATELAAKVSTSIRDRRSLGGTTVRTHIKDQGLLLGLA